jgi:hypothetical protein
MLPFLKNQHEASASGPVEAVKRESDHSDEYDVLEAAAEDLCKAIQSKDYKAAAAALRAAFELCGSQPDEEGSHE